MGNRREILTRPRETQGTIVDQEMVLLGGRSLDCQRAADVDPGGVIDAAVPAHVVPHQRQALAALIDDLATLAAELYFSGSLGGAPAMVETEVGPGGGRRD
jgi:hypothetical protein